MMSACPSPDVLRLWLDGELPADQSETIGSHVIECAACQSTVKTQTEHAGLRRLRESCSLDQIMDDEPAIDGLLARLGAGLSGLEGVLTIRENEGGAGPSERPATGLGEALGSLGTFQLLGELGRGGMGIVHRAWDSTLRREVAIKILRPEMAEPGYRLRLVREAQFAAQFRHDHAVLVFSVEDPADGLPYLVMEYVAGRSLAELLEAPTRPDIRQVATWIAQIASALDAAHAAGLIHRDVKPGNILIDDASGRAKIADFGLARDAGRAVTVTHVGWAAGTPTYMSPEQAKGDSRLDSRTDIYSLGATLYEALTGIPPYQGEPHLVLRQVIDEDPRPLRQLNDRVPRDLETICLEAMTKEPGGRYQAVAAMAEDLERWLRGEPILARPAGRAERFYRWCRRNPRVVGLSTALVVVLAAGFAGILWQWRRAEQNARRAETLRLEAQASLKDAQASFLQARGAVDQFYTRFYEQGLLKVPGLEKIRHDILAEMLDYYKIFVARHSDDPSLRRDIVEACVRIGLVTAEQGDPADALTLLRRALADIEQLGGDSRNDPHTRYNLLQCLNNIGQLESRLGDHDGALRTFERAIGLLRDRIREEPENPDVRERLAALSGNLANLRLNRGDAPHAREAYQTALECQQELVKQAPGNQAYLNSLGTTYNNMAMVVEDPSMTWELYQKALEIRRQLAERVPTNPLYRRNLARTSQNMGLTLDTKGRHEEAAKLLEEASRLLEQCVAEQPGVTLYQADFARALENVAINFGRRGKLDAAREPFLRAGSILRKLIHANPGDQSLSAILTHVEQNMKALEEEVAKARASRPAGAVTATAPKGAAPARGAGRP